MESKMKDKMDINELVDLALKEMEEDKTLEEKQNQIINRNKRLLVKTEVSHKVLSNKIGKVQKYSSFNEKFPEHTFNEPFNWNFSSKIDKTSLKNRVDKTKAHTKFNAKCLDLDLIDYFLSSYETKIDSINSRLEKLKAKLIYKPKKIYNLKKKIKKLRILPTIYEETTEDLKNQPMNCYTKTTSKKLLQFEIYESKIPDCKLVKKEFFVKSNSNSNIQTVAKEVDSTLGKTEKDLKIVPIKSDIEENKPDADNVNKVISSVKTDENYKCERGFLARNHLKVSEELLSCAKEENLKDSVKIYFNKGDSKALCLLSEEQKIDTLNVKRKDAPKMSKYLKRNQSFVRIIRQDLAPNSNLSSSETAIPKHQQKAHLSCKNTKSYETKLPDNESNCCGSEVNTESWDKEQSSYLYKFEKYASTTSFNESFPNDRDNIITNTRDKTNDIETWESIHSILSSGSETHKVPSYKKVTKNKNYSSKYFKFLRSNKIFPTSEESNEENKSKLKKFVSNAGKRLRNFLKNFKRNFFKSFSCFPNFD